MSRILMVFVILVGTLGIVVTHQPEPTPAVAPSIPAHQSITQGSERAPGASNERVSRHPRSREVTAEFQRENPCPATGKRSGACPGWIKDHRRALCIGGADEVSNLQWQTKEEAAAKDRWECDLADPRNK